MYIERGIPVPWLNCAPTADAIRRPGRCHDSATPISFFPPSRTVPAILNTNIRSRILRETCAESAGRVLRPPLGNRGGGQEDPGGSLSVIGYGGR